VAQVGRVAFQSGEITMKDRVARQLIAKIIKELDEMRQEISAIQHPHPKDCQCAICTGWSADVFGSLTIEESLALDEVKQP